VERTHEDDPSRYDRPPSPDEPDPEAFFEERGFALDLYEADGVGWVDLVARDNPEFRVTGYGRGDDPDRAALAAMRRWVVEQAT